jgi:O-antigen/teichoic acid export membrane protein
MSLARKGILLSAADKYATQALGVVTMAVMARLLTPAETGLYLVANSLILLADNFRALGVGVYIVQERDLDRAAVRAGFTVTLAMSLALGLGIWIGADAAAAFYGDPALAGLLTLAALGFVAIPFASPVVALMQRDMAFAQLARINVATALFGSTVTIGLGAAGAGPASFVWGYLAATASLAVLESWIFRPSIARAGAVVRFGAISTTVTLLNMAYEALPRLVFGKILGFEAVGLYGRALTVAQLPDRVIGGALTPVVLPVLATRARAHGDLKTAYLRGVSLMCGVQWPALAVLALLADPVVRVLLGSQWDAAAPLVRVMAIANMALAPAILTFPLLVSLGRISDTLRASLISLPPSAAIMIAVAPMGLNAVAASLCVTAPLQMLVALVFIRRAIGLDWRELWRAVRASVAVVAATVAAPCLLILGASDGLALDWGETAIAATGAAAGWLVAIRLSDHPLRAEIAAALRIAAERVGWRRTAGTGA